MLLPVKRPDLDAIPGQLPTALACSACGYRVSDLDPVVGRCPAAQPGDDVDHLLVRVLEPAQLGFPRSAEPNPFVRYRRLLHAYHVAVAAGWSDADLVAFIERLDHDVERIDGRGFRVTPLARSEVLSAQLGFAPTGGVLIKDETVNVSGSHKARHLFGTLLELELAGGPTNGASHPLAIASCGNAALAAAVVARSAEWPLKVFIPIGADPGVVDELNRLGAEVTVCERLPGAAGDPTYAGLRQALDHGAIAFTCQGNLNGLAIEGGETLGWELVSQLAETGRRIDRLVIQVGGGALASSVIQALREARDLGAIRSLPRIHALQTRGAFPVARAYERLAARLGPSPSPEEIDAELTYAAAHRSEFMWPWETEPHSVASGILDDETYDWRAVVGGMLLTGGSPLIVDEETLRRANRLAREATGIDVSATGSAGLAGVLDLQRRGAIGPDELVAVIFTGIRRSGDA